MRWAHEQKMRKATGIFVIFLLMTLVIVNSGVDLSIAKTENSKGKSPKSLEILEQTETTTDTTTDTTTTETTTETTTDTTTTDTTTDTTTTDTTTTETTTETTTDTTTTDTTTTETTTEDITPTITSTPVTLATVGLEYSYDVDATGYPEPTFRLTNSPDRMTIDPTSGLIQWTPTVAQLGDQLVTVKAENIAGEDEETFTIVVEEGEGAPEITSTPETSIKVGEQYTYDVEATGDPAPKFSLTKSPDGMTIDPTTGLIEWTPTNEQLGGNSVTIEAINTAGIDTQTFTIEVLAVEAEIDIDPDSLNMKSQGKFITVHIQLTDQIENIDLETVMLEDVPAVTDKKYGFVKNPAESLVDYDDDGIIERMVKFYRAEVEALIAEMNGVTNGKFYQIELTVTGQLLDGTPFEGSDTIKIINKTPNEKKSLGNSDIINSAKDSVYFIFPNYEGKKPSGVKGAKVTDWTAIGYLVGMCSNDQYETTDTDTNTIDPNSGAPKVTGKTIVLFGGPIVNAGVNHYEKKKMAPVYYQNDNGVNYWYTADGKRLDETRLTSSQISSGQDMFVIESLTDDAGNNVLIVYGYGWKGTFAAGKFLKSINSNMDSYTDSYYIFKWSDTDSDSFVDLNEISTTPITSGY
jgi:hypothetical protein